MTDDEYVQVGELPKLTVAYAASDGALYAHDDHFIFVSRDGGRSFERRGQLPKVDPGWLERVKDEVARSKLVRSIRHNRGPTNLVVLSTGTILVFFDHVYRSDDGGHTFSVAFDYNAAGVYAPFPFGPGVSVGPDDAVYFGEYTTVARPHPVRVLRGRDDGRTWEVAHEFPSGETFHVHSVHYDRYREGFWISTGDRESEVSLLFTEDDFASLERMGGGGQDWRMVSLMVTPDYLFWGSDDDQDLPGIFRFDPTQGSLERLASLPSVAYFSTVLSDGTLALSTTYEPESRLTQTRQPDPEATVWVSRTGEDWRELVSIPHRPEQLDWGESRASIAFPRGVPLDRLYLIPVSTTLARSSTLVVAPTTAR